jgi:hypothetical protein
MLCVPLDSGAVDPETLLHSGPFSSMVWCSVVTFALFSGLTFVGAAAIIEAQKVGVARVCEAITTVVQPFS